MVNHRHAILMISAYEARVRLGEPSSRDRGDLRGDPAGMIYGFSQITAGIQARQLGKSVQSLSPLHKAA